MRTDTPLNRLLAEIRGVLFLPHPVSLMALLGTVAANMIDGDPVWLMLVGPPGDGKTELLNLLLKVPHVSAVDAPQGAASFLSGTPAGEKSKTANGGLLRLVGPHGALLFGDFTDVVQAQPAKRDEIMTTLRRAADGRWTRPVGSDGGQQLSWEGRLACFGGVTSQIDQYAQLSAQMGERWVMCRSIVSDTLLKSLRAIDNSGHRGWREELQQRVKTFYEEVGIGFRGEPDKHRRPEISLAVQARVAWMADLSARGRSGVPRDPQQGNVVSGMVETETPNRLGRQLCQIYAGLQVIGANHKQTWEVLSKVALDSMPLLRKVILLEVFNGRCTPKGGIMLDDLKAKVKIAPAVLRRAVEDLELHNVLATEKDSTGKLMVTFSAHTWECVNKGWKGKL